MKNLFTAFLLVLLLGGTTIAHDKKQKQAENNNAITDLLQPVISAQVSGFVGEKLNLSYQNRILAQDVDRLISPFNNRTETSCWQSEFWGKWFTSAVLASIATGLNYH